LKTTYHLEVFHLIFEKPHLIEFAKYILRTLAPTPLDEILASLKRIKQHVVASSTSESEKD